MAKADRGSSEPNTTAAAKSGDASPFDQSRVQTERRAATERLLSRLRAIDRSHRAPSARSYAHHYVREQEPLILQLLDAGVGPGEILADLVMTFPSIPREDLRHAIWKLRDRRRKRSPVSTPSLGRVRSTGKEAVATNKRSPDREAHARHPGDQRPDESDEDYRLRKALEGSGATKRDFIGES